MSISEGSLISKTTLQSIKLTHFHVVHALLKTICKKRLPWLLAIKTSVGNHNVHVFLHYGCQLASWLPIVKHEVILIILVDTLTMTIGTSVGNHNVHVFLHYGRELASLLKVVNVCFIDNYYFLCPVFLHYDWRLASWLPVNDRYFFTVNQGLNVVDLPDFTLKICSKIG